MVNKVLFTSFSVVLANCDVSEDQLRVCRGEAIQRMTFYFEMYQEYSRAIQAATSSRNNVETQFWFAHQIEGELLA